MNSLSDFNSYIDKSFQIEKRGDQYAFSTEPISEEETSPISDKDILSISKDVFEKIKEQPKEFLSFAKKIKKNASPDVVKFVKKVEIMCADARFFSPKKTKGKLTETLTKTMESGKSSKHAHAKPLRLENLTPPTGVEPKTSFPKSSLTRLLTGDVPPHFLEGLGRMVDKDAERLKKKGGVKSTSPTPAKKTDTPKRLAAMEGYKDVFVSDLSEYQKRGITFDPNKVNDPNEFSKALNLMGSDADKIKKHGAWLFVITPSIPVAIPTKRQSQWNPEYIEGGFTKDKMQEWVASNLPLEKENLNGNVKIYKIGPDGTTEEWKFYKHKLYPVSERDKLIREHVKKVF